METTILKRCLISLNILDLSTEQLDIVKLAEKQLGEKKIEEILSGLSLNGIAGKTIYLSNLAIEEIENLNGVSIANLRFKFATKIFQALFDIDPNKEQRKIYYDLMSNWCRNIFSEKSKLIEACLSRKNTTFVEARNYLLDL